MNVDVAIVCRTCRRATIFCPDATYPRRCAGCAAVLRITAAPPVRADPPAEAERDGAPRARSA